MDRPTRASRDRGKLPELTNAEIDDREAVNGLLQFDLMIALIDQALALEDLVLTPELVSELQGIAVQGLEETAGQIREEPVSIGGTTHVPPPWQDVPALLQEMCDYVSEYWDTATAEHLAAYVMWRLNWIHPFTNGNGRTSRVISYMVFCAKLGFNLPGESTIPEIIDRDKGRYYLALEEADARWIERETQGLANQQADVGQMEQVILDALDVQLSAIDLDDNDGPLIED